MIAFILSLLISLRFSPEQFTKLTDGLSESVTFFLTLSRWKQREFSGERLTKELMLHFGELLSTVLDDALRHKLTEYLAATFGNDFAVPKEIFSYVPYLSLFQLLCCGGDYVTVSIVNVMQRVLGQLGSEKIFALKDQGLWRILFAVLGHSCLDVFESTSAVMAVLAGRSYGWDYADFLENNYFEELIKRLPHPELVTAELLLPPDAVCPPTDFTALGMAWSAFFLFLSADGFLL
jgi:hypothetical protein